MAHKSIILRVLLFFLQYYLVLAQDKPCGDHNVKVEQFKNCPEPSAKDQNIRVHNVTFTLTDDCKLVPRGCFNVKKSISAAQIEYYINKPPFKKKGTEDFCKLLDSPDSQKNLESFKSVPRKCTIQAGNYCITKGSTKVEQLNPKTLSFLSGTTTGYFNIQSEGSNDKGCVEFKLVVSKK